LFVERDNKRPHDRTQLRGQAEIPPAVDPNESEAAAQKRVGDEAYSREDYMAALEAYTASLRHDTSDTKVWANRAAAALKLGDYAMALADARKARTLKPDNLKVRQPFETCLSLRAFRARSPAEFRFRDLRGE
jgi:tetratricopeptide (TPR) repeat protein